MKPRQLKPGLNLWAHKLVHRIDLLTNSALASAGIEITNSQYLTLKAVYECEGSTQRQVANFLGISSAALTRHVTILSSKGLVDVAGLEYRAHSLTLTNKGKQVLMEATQLLQDYLRVKIKNYDKLVELIQD